MPNCFQLLRDDAPVSLNAIDEELCRHFGADCHPKHYYKNWYDIIGYDLAMGRTFDEIKHLLTIAGYDDVPTLVQIIEWLESRFTARSWVEIGRR